MREFISRLRIFYVDVPALRPGTIGAYLLSFVSVGVATALRLAIDPYVEGLQFATFIVAVTLTTLISGFGSGLFSVVLSIAAVAVFVLPPHLSFYIEQPGDVLALLLYTVVMLFNVALITGMRVAVERQRDQQALQETKDRLQSALDAARLGSWRYDARRRVFSWDARSKEIFGVPQDGATVEEFMNWVHPDDEKKVWAAYHRALDPAQPERSQTQFRVRRENGEVRWVETQGLGHLEGAGRERQVVGFSGTVQDVTARKSAQEAQARLAAIVTSSADAIVGKTLDGVVTNWNEAAERMFGYSAAEMIGQSIRRVIPSDRQAKEEMIRSRVAQGGTIERYEMMLLAKDGRTFDASITISPIRDAEGRIIGCSKIIRDITARKRAEKQVGLLMREATHRAKNMLSLVHAIARQTAAREPEDFVGRFTERIQALAANQDLLVRNEWHGVDVEDLVRAQLAHFADLVGPRIATHGPKVRLNPTAAQGIGLALHELATNAGKYGALSTHTGRVDICWGTDGDTLTMSWTEREGPLVSAPKRRGFGTMVIEGMAKQSVEGAVELAYAPRGLTWRLTCPAVNALEPCEPNRVRNPANEMALVGMERDLSPADLRAVRRGIGAALRALYSDVLREEIPDRIAELVSQLDQQLRQLDQENRHST
jgi:PAS domain S-box-containing protein